jgi:hypothetical protein
VPYLRGWEGYVVAMKGEEPLLGSRRRRGASKKRNCELAELDDVELHYEGSRGQAQQVRRQLDFHPAFHRVPCSQAVIQRTVGALKGDALYWAKTCCSADFLEEKGVLEIDYGKVGREQK